MWLGIEFPQTAFGDSPLLSHRGVAVVLVGGDDLGQSRLLIGFGVILGPAHLVVLLLEDWSRRSWIPLK